MTERFAGPSYLILSICMVYTKILINEIKLVGASVFLLFFFFQ